MGRLSNAKQRVSRTAPLVQPRAAEASNKATLMARSATVSAAQREEPVEQTELHKEKDETAPIVQNTQQSAATTAELLRRKKKQKSEPPTGQ